MSDNIIRFEELPSTNDYLKEKAQEGLPAWTAVLANGQSQGRGKRGRNFFSPRGSGLYMSVLLRELPLSPDSIMLTSLAALAAVQAIEEVVYVSPAIKWVNDLYLNNKKVAGILTEAVASPQSGKLDSVVIGLGVNLYPPEEGFPEELNSSAGTLLSRKPEGPDLSDRLAQAFLKNLHYVIECKDRMRLLRTYRERSLLIGHKVLLRDGNSECRGLAAGINESGCLLLKIGTGELRSFNCGDVSLLA